jgi:hypothetical protein
MLSFELKLPKKSYARPGILLLCCRCIFIHKQKNRHFDRSCSQSYREQRSGEIRFSTHASPWMRPAFEFAVEGFSNANANATSSQRTSLINPSVLPSGSFRNAIQSSWSAILATRCGA